MTWGLIGDLLMHLSAYVFGDYEVQAIEPQIFLLMFGIPSALALISIFFKFAIGSSASKALKLFLFLFTVIGFVVFKTDDNLIDLTWHYNHSALHFITLCFLGVCSHYLEMRNPIKGVVREKTH